MPLNEVSRNRLRRDLPEACDRCGAPQARLLPILYGRMDGMSLGVNGDDFYHAGCLVMPETWVCRACWKFGMVSGQSSPV